METRSRKWIPVSTLLSEDEIEVVKILLDLQNSIVVSESPERRLAWGCKRKRSSLSHDQMIPNKVEAQSPDTPFCFSLIEFHEDSCKKSAKRRLLNCGSSAFANEQLLIEDGTVIKEKFQCPDLNIPFEEEEEQTDWCGGRVAAVGYGQMHITAVGC